MTVTTMRTSQLIAAREKDDFYPTPHPVTRALIARERFGAAEEVWEPACGDGAMCKVLAAAGIKTIGTDLVDRGWGTPRVDFLLERKLLAPNIVTNPPFKHGEAFIRHALELGARKVALLLPTLFLEGQERRRIMESTPLARVWVAARRINMSTRVDRSAKSFSWFVWEVGHNGPATLGFFDWQEHVS